MINFNSYNFKRYVFEFHTLICLLYEAETILIFKALTQSETIFTFEGIIAIDLIQSVCPINVGINWNEVEFHTLIVSSHEPETIFSFEGIIAKDLTALSCSFKFLIKINFFECQKY